ncbi:hypothetical protein MM326_18855 [Alkalihalobacillus sp. LMS6]|uniref:hypothetical protein n=1 Tax=Alkalihalobacillus sp. LMS6 TaxID=2924034 RepID=UPI0020D14EC6|nr:hypothetical protein [Alkalihalobacillus sp. LMS6]UTR06112.1 hypothetical protein MM326_18855 [Alkalihalobacillus sp. LMS6]
MIKILNLSSRSYIAFATLILSTLLNYFVFTTVGTVESIFINLLLGLVTIACIFFIEWSNLLIIGILLTIPTVLFLLYIGMIFIIFRHGPLHVSVNVYLVGLIRSLF